MKHLWAPWRMEYLIEPKRKKGVCIFCVLPKEKDDKKNLIVLRKKKVFVILNKYPYNNGHLMIVPYQHCNSPEMVESKAWADVMHVAALSTFVLKKIYNPQGFNLGMNLGECGGAGIKDHLHLHIVPRWSGDTNFMPLLADTKTLPEHLTNSWEKLSKAFGEMS